MQFVGNGVPTNSMKIETMKNWDTTRFHINKGIVPGYWKEKQEK